MASKAAKQSAPKPAKAAPAAATQASAASFGGVPSAANAKGVLQNMKHEIASELGINLKQGYNGDLSSKQAGSIGGYMVKRLVQQALKGKQQ
jgi:hypothetical protein